MSTENWKTDKGGGIALVMREEYYVKKLDKAQPMIALNMLSGQQG